MTTAARPGEVARLRGRLEREKNARREAEELSERAIRDLYDQRAELALLERVVVASNDVDSPEEAFQRALDEICAYTGWPVGHVYLRAAEGPDELVPTELWHLDEPERYETLRQVTAHTRLRKGVGLPGRVLKTGKPVWIADVTAHENFPRARHTSDVGVKTALAFPVVLGGEVVAVLEFFSPHATEPQQGLLERVAHIGAQLGRVIERKRAETAVRQAEVQYRSLVERLPAITYIAGVGPSGRWTYVSPQIERILGYPPEQWLADPDLWSERMHPDDRERVLAKEERRSTRGVPLVSEYRVYARDGTLRWLRDEAVVVEGEGQGPASLQGVIFDITERRRFESQLQYLADHDPLTGLFNRRRLEQELDRMVGYARQLGTPSAAIILDLDNFKLVNDTLGHRAGDELICGVATVLRKRLRETDVIARVGGDEFAILLPAVLAEDARRVASELGDLVRRHTMVADGTPVRVTTSLGIALLEPGDEEITGADLLVRADVALYAAKDAGRDRLDIYTPQHGEAVRMAAGVSSGERIRRALEEDRFVLYHQPILELAGDRVTQVEVLLRLEADNGEMLPPGAFLPAAERFGLVREIDRWVVRAAIQALAALRRTDPDRGLVLEVNLSGKSIGDETLPPLIEEELARTGVAPRQLIFEITETAAIANMAEARAFAMRLAGLGCRFALDDFGAGFGSFYYLKYLPLSYLKIDGEFIQSLPRSQGDQRVVRAMVDVARGLGLETIAEFVEDQETLDLLREYGVDYAQGYHVGRPRPLDGVAEWVSP